MEVQTQGSASPGNVGSMASFKEQERAVHKRRVKQQRKDRRRSKSATSAASVSAATPASPIDECPICLVP